MLVVSFAVLLNLAADSIALAQVFSTQKSGDWIHHTYNVIKKINEFENLFLRADYFKDQSSSGDAIISLDNEASALESLVADNPMQIENLHGIKKMLVDWQNSHLLRDKVVVIKVLASFDSMKAQENALLKARVESDTIENKKLLYKTLFAISVDLSIIVLLSGLYFLDLSLKNKIEKSLRDAVERLVLTNQTLYESNLMKSKLFRTTVHDLKNPIGAMRGFAELLNDRSMNPHSVFDMSARIRRIANNTLELVDSLIRPEALEHGLIHLDKKQTDLIDLVADVCKGLGVLAQSKGQKIECSLSPANLIAAVDPISIRDVMFNIVGNAIKFSPMGTVIRVSSSIEDQRLRVMVDDQGPGFTEDDRERAFRPGQVLSAKPTGKELSTGLGLFSAKQNIDRHKGDITICKNPSGQGSRVIIEIPILEDELLLKPQVTELVAAQSLERTH